MIKNLFAAYFNEANENHMAYILKHQYVYNCAYEDWFYSPQLYTHSCFNMYAI